MIKGVLIKKVTKHLDERGFFAELVKFGENNMMIIAILGKVAHGYKSLGKKYK